MNRPLLFVAITLLTPTLAACSVDEADSADESLRAIVVSDSWGIHGPVSFPDVNSCDDYWNNICANLTADQCTIAHNRYTCTQASQGVVITDNFGELAESLEWDGYSVGDEGPSTGDSAAAACEGMTGIELEECLNLAQVAELVASKAPELITKFPSGGFASLTIRDDILTVEPLGPIGDDMVYTAADALDWRVPLIGDELALGKLTGIVIEDIIMTVRPNGTISVSNNYAALMQRQKQPPPPSFDFLAHYSMSAPGADYIGGYIGVIGGWSRHAAKWKAYVDLNVGSVDLASAYQGNILHPLVGAESELNLHESLYFEDIWGNTYDPNGTWMSEDIDDPLTGLAFAAMVMHYWHSPVYFNGVWTPSLQIAPAGAWYHEFALEQVTFRIPNAPTLHDACGISPSASAVTALAAIQTCDLTGVTLEGGIVSAWLGDYSPGNSPTYLHHQSIGGADLMSSYAAGFSWGPNWHSGRVGELVFDPPAEASEDEIAAVRALAGVLANELREQVPMKELVE